MNVNLNLPQEVQNLLLGFAKEKNTTTENLIKEAVVEFIEDLRDAKLAQQAHDEYVASGKKTIDASELYEKLGL